MTTRWRGRSFVADVWVKRSCEAAIMLLLVSLGACAQKPNGDSDEAVSARQNALIEAPISQFALLARHGMIFKDRVYEIGGNIGIAAGGSPLNTMNIGSDARVAIGKIIASPHVILAPRTVVGEVDATQVEATGATIAKRMPFVAPPAIPVPGPIAAGTAPVTVAMGQNQTLSAGKFGVVEVVAQGTLTLSGGIYQFASLKLGELSRVVAKGSTIVKVAGTVVAANRVQLAPVAPLKARDLRFEIGGVTPGTSNGFTLGNDCTLTALVVAQRGVSIGDRLIGSGAMAAEDVALGFDSKLTLDGGFGCAAQADCSTDGVCVAGTCVDSPLIACQAADISRVPVDPGQPFDLATSSTRLYWTDTAAGAVKSAMLTGAGISTLVTGHPGIGGLAVDSSFVYYTDVLEKSVSRIPISGGSAEVIAANQRMPRFLVSDGDSLYWTNQGTGNADGSVRRFTKSTGTLDAIADRQPGPFTLTSSSGRVSWSDVASGSVLTRSALTAPIEVIASGLRQPRVLPHPIVSPTRCPCGGRLKFIALILEEDPARAILESLHLPSEPPPIARARSPDWLEPIPLDT